jgi:hypothetical protein
MVQTGSYNVQAGTSHDIHYGSGNTGSYGGNETRSKNAYVLYIIKY